MDGTRLIVVAVVIAAMLVGGYFVFTAKRQQAETPALDSVAGMLANAKREHGRVSGTLDGRAIQYLNYLSRQTTYSEVRIAAPGAPRFDNVDGLGLDGDLKKQLAQLHPFRVSCDGNELRVQADHIIKDGEEGRALVTLAGALAARISPR